MLLDVDDGDLLAHLRVRTQQLLRELAAAPGQAAVRAGKLAPATLHFEPAQQHIFDIRTIIVRPKLFFLYLLTRIHCNYQATASASALRDQRHGAGRFVQDWM